MKVAMCQLDMGFENSKQNYGKIESFVQEASQNHTDIIVFPELTFSGFSMDCKKIVDTGKETAFVKELSLKYNVKILFGRVSKQENIFNNTASIIDGDSEVLSYHKIHPFTYESQFYGKGDRIVCEKINDFYCSVLICYDLRFPEIFQIASKQADIIFVIASWPAIRDDHWLTLLKARAIENQCFIVGVNRKGIDPDSEYIGHSATFDPWGKALNTLSTREEIIYIDIDKNRIDSIRKENNFKVDRRNDLYRELLE